MSNRIKKKSETKSSFREGTALLMGIFALGVLCLLPLVVTNYYFNILETKYIFYCIIAVGTAVLLGGYGLYTGKIMAFFREKRWKSAVKSMDFVDWAMLAFWLSNLISWILCTDWRYDAFWGTFGRYNGLFLMTVYMVVYFLVTRFFHLRRWYLDAFLLVGLFVSIFGITDYFQMDILGFKVNMLEEQKTGYTSTFGNINTYTVYVGALAVVSMLLFSLEKNRKRALWYFGNLIVSLFALIMGTSDNAYLTLAALFGLAPLYLFRTKTGLRRYLLSLAALVTVIWCIVWINKTYAETVIGIQSLFTIAEKFSGLPRLAAGAWAAAVVIAALTLLPGKKDASDEIAAGKWLAAIWAVLVVLAVAAAAYIFYDANVAGNADKYQAFRNYVIYNDAWGTGRGYVWTRCMTIFNERFTGLQKIFGYGPDMLRILMNYYYPVGRNGNSSVVFDSAHNEYLHYMLTIGIAGMLSYLAFMGGAVVQLSRKMKGRPEVAAILFVVVAYMVQAIVNINLPIAMPIIIQLLSMGLSRSAAREA